MVRTASCRLTTRSTADASVICLAVARIGLLDFMRVLDAATMFCSVEEFTCPGCSINDMITKNERASVPIARKMTARKRCSACEYFMLASCPMLAVAWLRIKGRGRRGEREERGREEEDFPPK